MSPTPRLAPDRLAQIFWVKTCSSRACAWKVLTQISFMIFLANCIYWLPREDKGRGSSVWTTAHYVAD